MKRQRSTWIVDYAGILALLCSFVIGSLVLMNVGVHVYKNIVENNAQNFKLRASLSYVATKVRQNDGKDSVYVKEENGVPILVLTEETDGERYRTMIYCYKGALRELFQEESMEYKLEDGLEVMELSGFMVSQPSDKKLELTVENNKEKEQLVLNLRSE